MARRAVIPMAGSLRHTASTGSVQMGDIWDKERTESWSVSMWARHADATQVLGGRLRVAGTVTGWEIQQNVGVGIKFTLLSTAINGLNPQIPPQHIPYGTWYSLVFTYDGSSTAAGVKGYINGVQKTMTAGSLDNLNASIIGTSVNLTWGARQGGSTGVVGNTTRYRLYNRVLTAAEVLDLHNNDVVPSGACAHEWLHTDAEGTTLTATVGGVNGTITTPVWSGDVPSQRRRVLNPIAGNLVFPATTSKVTVPNTAGLRPGTGGFAVAFWYRHTGDATASSIVQGGGSSTESFTLYRTNATQFGVYVQSGGASALFSGSPLGNAGVWHRIFVTFNHSDLKVRVYRNGSLIEASAAISAWNITSTSVTEIGATTNGLSALVGCSIADVSFYKGTCPTTAEVAADYFEGTQHSTCVHRYKLTEGTGSTAADVVGGNTATLGGASPPTWATSVPMVARATASARRAVIPIPYALQMNGVSGYSNHGNVYDKDNTDAWAMSCWINLGPSSSQQCIAAHYIAVAGWVWWFDSAGFRFETYSNTGVGGSGAMRLSWAVPKSLVEGWVHVVCNVQATKSTSDIYVNGALRGSKSLNQNNMSGTMLGGATEFYLGIRTGLFIPLNGMLTKFRMHSRALTATEITNLYLNDVDPAPDGAALMTDGSGTTLTGTGTMPNGTITTPAWVTNTPLKARTTA